jgi:hypothetical protein
VRDFAGIVRGEARVEIGSRSYVVALGICFADEDADVVEHRLPDVMPSSSWLAKP